MKKYIKTTIATACILTALATLGASAATKLDYNLNKSYDVLNQLKVVNSVYDIGSAMPWDDVCSKTRVVSTEGLSVTARAITTARNGDVKKSELNQKNVSGWVDSGWAQVDGQDYAKKVQHQAYRKFIANGVMDKIYEYEIT